MLLGYDVCRKIYATENHVRVQKLNTYIVSTRVKEIRVIGKVTIAKYVDPNRD